MHEVQRIAIQLIADAQIRGELHKGYHDVLSSVCSILLIVLSLYSWLAHLTTNEHGDCLLESMNSTGKGTIRSYCNFKLSDTPRIRKIKERLSFLLPLETIPRSFQHGYVEKYRTDCIPQCNATT